MAKWFDIPFIYSPNSGPQVDAIVVICPNVVDKMCSAVNGKSNQTGGDMGRHPQ